MKRRVVLERFAHRQKGVVASALRDVSQSRWDVVPGDLLAKPVDRSPIRLEETGEAKEERGFPSARPSAKPNDLARSDIDTDIAQRGYRDGSRSRAGLVRLVEA